MNHDGKEFICTKHGLDYRIICDECKEKNDHLMQVLEEQRIDYSEGYASQKDYEEANS